MTAMGGSGNSSGAQRFCEPANSGKAGDARPAEVFHVAADGNSPQLRAIISVKRVEEGPTAHSDAGAHPGGALYYCNTGAIVLPDRENRPVGPTLPVRGRDGPDEDGSIGDALRADICPTTCPEESTIPGILADLPEPRIEQFGVEAIAETKCAEWGCRLDPEIPARSRMDLSVGGNIRVHHLLHEIRDRTPRSAQPWRTGVVTAPSMGTASLTRKRNMRRYPVATELPCYGRLLDVSLGR